MTLQLQEALAITTAMGDQLVSTGTVLTFSSIVISYDASIPRTWDYLGYMYREILVNDDWTIISSHTLIPGRPNLFTWDDTAPYRLSFRLVKYIYDGNLLIYSYNAPEPLELSLVAYSGNYADLINLPVIPEYVPQDFSWEAITNKPALGLGFTFIQAEAPSNPVNGDTWLELSSLSLARNIWVYDASLGKWLSDLRTVQINTVNTSGSNGIYVDTQSEYGQSILIESSKVALSIGSGQWTLGRRRTELNPLASNAAITSTTGVDSAPYDVGFHIVEHNDRILLDSPNGTQKIGFAILRTSASGNIAAQCVYRYRLVKN